MAQFLTIGCTAAVAAAGAALIPLPTVPEVVLPARLAANVTLAGFDDPFGALIGTTQVAANDLFDGLDTIPDYPWLPFQGLGPEFIYTALPIVSQLGFNGFDNLDDAFEVLSTSAAILTGALWNLPGAVVTAIGQLIDGHPGEAITTLVDATLVPVQNAVSYTLGTGLEILGGVIANLTNVVASVPGIVTGLAGTLGGGVSALVAAAATVGAQTISALAALDLEQAWNTLVNGLLGPVGADGLVTSSLPGTLLAMTIGPGLGPLGYPNGYQTPSLRMWAEESQLTIANAVGANFPVSVPAATPTAAHAEIAPARQPSPAAAVESLGTQSAPDPSNSPTTADMPPPRGGPTGKAGARSANAGEPARADHDDAARPSRATRGVDRAA